MTTNYKTLRTPKPSTFDRYNTSRVRIGAGVLFLVLLVLYVFQTSTLATRTFVINDLERELRDLKQANDTLDVQIAEERALSRVVARLDGASFTAVDNIAYLSPVGSAVAVNQ